MTPALKLVRDLVDRRVAQIGDPDLVAMLAAERAAADATSEASTSPQTRTIVTKAQLAEVLRLGVEAEDEQPDEQPVEGKRPRPPGERTIETMVKDGRIPPDAIIRVGRRVRFDLERVIDALRGKGPAETRGAAWAGRRSRLKVIAGG